MGKKKFIDKKKAQHFVLVHRSQRDPLSADSEASPYVLLPVNPGPSQTAKPSSTQEKWEAAFGDEDDEEFEGDEFADKYDEEEERPHRCNKVKDQDRFADAEEGDELDESSSAQPKATTSKIPDRFQDAEEDKDDLPAASQAKSSQPRQRNLVNQAGHVVEAEYDYMQHLMPIGGGTFVDAKTGRASDPQAVHRITLPPEVLPPKREEAVGILNRALPLTFDPELDPDIMRALEGNDDEEFEELEDDFVLKATSSVPPEGEPSSSRRRPSGSGSGSEDGYDGHDGSEGDVSGGNRHRPGLSVASSYARVYKDRLLDDQFQHLMKEYEDGAEEGSDSDEEIQGENLIEQFDEILDEFLDDQMPLLKSMAADGLNKVTKLSIPEVEEDGDEGRDQLFEMVEAEQDRDDHLDCESIITTYTNTDNHPTVIAEPRRQRKVQPITLSKSGIPVDYLPNRAEPAASEASDEPTTATNLGEPRRRDETPEERKGRKQAVKQQNKENRQKKKATKLQFRDELLRQRQLLADPAQAQSAAFRL